MSTEYLPGASVPAGVQVYEYDRLLPEARFCELQTWVATAAPDELKICNSTFPLVSPPEPVSMTFTEMEAVPPATNVDGPVAEDVNDTGELTVMLAADEFQFHCCQVALNTPTSTV